MRSSLGPTARALLALAMAVPLSACGYGASKLAHRAQLSMIGMSVNDLQACAGPPDKTTKLNPAAEIFTYEYKPAANGGLTIDLPLNLGGIAIGGSGTYCRADLRLVDHRVTELHYAGDDDDAVGSDGVCAALVRGCLRQPEPTMVSPEPPRRQRVPSARRAAPAAVRGDAVEGQGLCPWTPLRAVALRTPHSSRAGLGALAPSWVQGQSPWPSQQTQSRPPSRIRHPLPRQHPRDLLLPLRPIQRHHIGQSRPVRHPLGHPKMMRPPRRHLRRVRHHQHLTRARHQRQPLSHRRRRRPAHPGIHLVEHQRLHGRPRRQHHLERQHQPRQLAPGRHPPQRPGAAVPDWRQSGTPPRPPPPRSTRSHPARSPRPRTAPAPAEAVPAPPSPPSRAAPPPPAAPPPNARKPQRTPPATAPSAPPARRSPESPHPAPPGAPANSPAMPAAPTAAPHAFAPPPAAANSRSSAASSARGSRPPPRRPAG